LEDGNIGHELIFFNIIVLYEIHRENLKGPKTFVHGLVSWDDSEQKINEK
jgi:hypothetical protein